MRTKEMYYDNLERVITRFPNQELIPVKDAAAFLGGISPRSLYEAKNTPCKRVGGRWYITAVALARWLS
jgi:hypothetical protein